MKRFLAIMMILSIGLLQASTTRILDGSSITNSGAILTLPTSTDTVVGRATTDTLTNKSISGSTNTLTNIPVSAIAGGALSGVNSGDVTIGTGSGLTLSAQVLSLGLASSGVTGALLGSDWTLFNGKLTSSLTTDHIHIGVAGVATDSAVNGDISLSAGSFAIGALKVTVAKMSSGAAAAGTVLTANGSGGVAYALLAPGTSGTDASPTTVTAAGGIVFSGTSYENYYFITAASPITITATPQISAGTNLGQRLVLSSKSATNTVTLADGNGLSLNGPWVGGLDSEIVMFWNGSSKWVEISRR